MSDPGPVESAAAGERSAAARDNHGNMVTGDRATVNNIKVFLRDPADQARITQLEAQLRDRERALWSAQRKIEALAGEKRQLESEIERRGQALSSMADLLESAREKTRTLDAALREEKQLRAEIEVIKREIVAVRTRVSRRTRTIIAYAGLLLLTVPVLLIYRFFTPDPDPNGYDPPPFEHSTPSYWLQCAQVSRPVIEDGKLWVVLSSTGAGVSTAVPLVRFYLEVRPPGFSGSYYKSVDKAVSDIQPSTTLPSPLNESMPQIMDQGLPRAALKRGADYRIRLLAVSETVAGQIAAGQRGKGYQSRGFQLPVPNPGEAHLCSTATVRYR